MDSLKDLLKSKADKLDVDQKLDELALCQQVFKRYYADQAKVTKFNDSKLFVLVRSSSLASEVRLNQLTLIEELNRLLSTKVERLIIRQ
ncbi:MAG TPA: DciA family protein [Candidatus Saccharimonadales bacterium]